MVPKKLLQSRRTLSNYCYRVDEFMGGAQPFRDGYQYISTPYFACRFKDVTPDTKDAHVIRDVSFVFSNSHNGLLRGNCESVSEADIDFTSGIVFNRYTFNPNTLKKVRNCFGHNVKYELYKADPERDLCTLYIYSQNGDEAVILPIRNRCSIGGGTT